MNLPEQIFPERDHILRSISVDAVPIIHDQQLFYIRPNQDALIPCFSKVSKHFYISEK